MNKLTMVLMLGVAAAAPQPARWHRLPEIHQRPEMHVCNGEHDTVRTELIGKATCGMPRDEFLHLVPEGSHLQVSPSAVWVKRCRGICKNGKECIATKSREIKIPVRYTDVTTMKETCATYTLKEHLECGCSCIGSAADCRPGTKFNHRARTLRKPFRPEVETVS